MPEISVTWSADGNAYKFCLSHERGSGATIATQPKRDLDDAWARVETAMAALRAALG